MLTKNDTTFSKTSLLNDVFTSVEIHRPGEHKFDFAFSLIANGIDYLKDPTVFDFSIGQIEQKWITKNGVATPDRNRTELLYNK